MSKHKYLKEVFGKKNIPFPFCENGYAAFDKRDTYCLDYTFVCWMYERLRYFQDQTIVNLHYHKFEIDGEELYQDECIQRMIDDCKILMKYDELEKDSFNGVELAKNDLFKVFSAVYFALWW